MRWEIRVGHELAVFAADEIFRRIADLVMSVCGLAGTIETGSASFKRSELEILCASEC